MPRHNAPGINRTRARVQPDTNVDLFKELDQSDRGAPAFSNVLREGLD